MIRGTKRALEESRPTVKADLRASIHNRFDIEVVDAKTGEIKNKAVAYNVICNRLWTTVLSTSPRYFQCIHYGSGTGTPSATDTSLFTFEGYANIDTTKDQFKYDAGGKWSSVTRRAQLAPEVAVGKTITEVGIASDPSASYLCTHAMLEDMNGNPISITKTDTDIINLYATVFVHYGIESGGNCKVEVMPYRDASYTSYYPNVLLDHLFGIQSTTFGSGSHLWSAGGAQGPFDYWYYGGANPNYFSEKKKMYFEIGGSVTYNTSQKTMTLTENRVGVSDGNVGGFRHLILMGPAGHNDRSNVYFPYLNVSFAGFGVPFSRVTGEAIGTGDGSTVNFKTKFPMISNATVYVDGVTQSGVTIDENVPTDNKVMGAYFDYVSDFSSETINYGADFNTAYCSYQISSPKGYVTYYNPFYAKGIDSLNKNGSCEIFVSNDGEHWDTLFDRTQTGTLSVPAEHKNKKYWRMQCVAANGECRTLTCNSISEYNVHFDTPPAAGAVITMDYDTDSVAKDENHVFDLTITIQLGEYTE